MTFQRETIRYPDDARKIVHSMPIFFLFGHIKTAIRRPKRDAVHLEIFKGYPNDVQEIIHIIRKRLPFGNIMVTILVSNVLVVK